MRVPGVEELSVGPPEQVAAENAHRKAAATVPRSSSEWILGVDTVVALDGRIYGKPADEAAARRTLEALSGRRHAVISGLCLISAGGQQTVVARTMVEFRSLSGAIVDWYLKSGEWLGRAGGYAIQGRGAALVARIEGDYLNVVGLPVASLLALAPELLDRSR